MSGCSKFLAQGQYWAFCGEAGISGGSTLCTECGGDLLLKGKGKEKQPNKWDKRFIELAYFVSKWSKDPSTKCGCVIVKNKEIISMGYNGFPKNTDDSEKLYMNRPEKIRRVLHAEMNALLYAKQDLKDCTLYVVPMPPCSKCCGMIIQKGIKKVITIKPTKEQEKRWKDDFKSTKQMFNESGVLMEYL